MWFVFISFLYGFSFHIFAVVYDYLIIGGGLAGTSLAYRLIKQGAKVMVIDEPSKNISSTVAAGIFNPITGKRTALTWKANEMFDELHAFYPKLEAEMGEYFFYPLPFYKLFDSIFDQNEWLNKQQESGFNQFIEPQIQFLNNKRVENPFGALQIIKAGRLDTKTFLKALQNWLLSQNAILFQNFDYTNVEVTNEIIKYNDLKAQAIIFCDGPNSLANPFFNYLPHKPVHGEILEVEISDFYEDRVINKGVFVLPTGNNKFFVGSTYNWDLTEPITTPAGREEIETKLKEMVKTEFKTTGHWAGIRPSTKDRRAYLGQHPTYKNLYIFGGFGSKGVSLIPYLSKVFTNYLLHDDELPKEVDICRVR
jgi:glycine/D-amino acid oxidase-like deaminating enzyme